MKKITYDVEIPQKCQDNCIYANDFREFYNSEHANACIEYEDIDTAVRAQKSMCMLRNREGIHDAVVTRRKNRLYFVRTKAGKSC